MKRSILITVLVIAVLAMSVTFVLARSADETTTPVPAQAGPNFVDENGDGLCDNCASGQGRMGNPDAPRPNFVDENGDGVCDLMGAEGHGPRMGQGQGMGQGPNFVDENGDGVCDLMGTEGHTPGQGMGRGARGQGQGMGRMWRSGQANANSGD